MVVKSEELLNNAVQAVRDWVRGLPTGVVTLEEEVTNYEHVLSILPRHQASAPVTFRLNTRASFGLYIGSCIRVEELPLSIENMLEICNAAYNGFVEEDRWLIGETPIKSCGVIRLH